MKIKNRTRSLLSVLPFAFAAAMFAAAPRVSAMPALPAAEVAAQLVADEDLEDRVRGALGARIGKPAQEIGVSARDGTVMLFGAVRTASVRDRAARTTVNVLGVRTVVNALTLIRGS